MIDARLHEAILQVLLWASSNHNSMVRVPRAEFEELRAAFNAVTDNE